MELELKKGLHQTQKQVLQMTQEMKQSIHVLQMDLPELREYIEEMALENPAIDLDALHQSAQPEEIRRKKREWLEQLAQGDRQNIAYYDRDQENLLERTVAAPVQETLEEHLLTQAADIQDEAVRSAVKYLAGCLDEDGYFRLEIEQLAVSAPFDVEQLRRGLERLKTMDPAGVGAENLPECLLLQLPQEDEVARHLAGRYLDHIARKRIDAISKELSVSREAVEQAVERIRRLNPRPGNMFLREEHHHYLTPDIVVTGFQDHYLVLPCDFQLPDVKISAYATELMEEADAETKGYLEEKVKQVEWLCRCVAGRSETLLRVAKEIVHRQEDFFRLGPQYLGVLRMAEVAGTLELHESTVSRAVKGKYLQCAHGIYPLRYFFVQSARLGGGENDVSAHTAKHRIRELIDGEEHGKPLSDQKLSEILAGEGIPISRRTVAKYRDGMGIPNSSHRG